MSVAQNKDLVRRFTTAFSIGEVTNLDDYFAPDAVDHTSLPGQPAGREGAERVTQLLHQGFPDLSQDIKELIGEGDRVAFVILTTGTHQGEFMGAPPTGHSFTAPEIRHVRIANDKMVDHWGLADQVGMMTQLGLMPAPPVPAGWRPNYERAEYGGQVDAPDENKLFVRRLAELFNAGKTGDFLDMLDENAIDHTAMPGQQPGRVGWEWRVENLMGAFSEPTFRVEDQIAEGDLVSTRYTFRTQHTGDLMGLPATGRPVQVPAMDMIRVRDGRLVEHWGLIDFPGMMAQLGLDQTTPRP